MLGRPGIHFLVGFVFVTQAAHQPAAASRDLLGVKRKVLLLCHANGNRRELTAQAFAAQLLAAVAQAAH